MKKILLISISVFFLMGSTTVRTTTKSKRFKKNDIIRIEITDDDDFSEKSYGKKKKRWNSIDKLSRENWKLKRRVRNLERAVAQLQDYVFDLQVKEREREREDNKPAYEPKWACSIEVFGAGTFVGEASTKVMATAKAKKQCERKRSAVFCDGSNTTKCEKAE